MTAWDLCSLINGLVLQINQPPPFALWVLTPAALLLFWLEIRHSRRAALATVSCVAVIAFVHPTYAIPCLAIAAGMLAGAWRAGSPRPARAARDAGRDDRDGWRHRRRGSGGRPSAAAIATRCSPTPTSS